MYGQWLTEHKCRPGRRPQMPPFQENCFDLRRKKCQTNPKNFWRPFLVIDQKIKFYVYRISALSAAPFDLFRPLI